MMSSFRPTRIGNVGFYRRNPPLMGGMVGFWEFEASGNLGLDSHARNHIDLTNVNSCTQVAGLKNFGVNFTAASSQYLTGALQASMIAPTTGATICSWIKMTTKAQFNVMLYVGEPVVVGGAQYGLIYRGAAASDRFRFDYYYPNINNTGPTTQDEQFGSPSLATWYFVRGWIDGVKWTRNIQVNAGKITSLPANRGGRVNTSGDPTNSNYNLNMGRLESTDYSNQAQDQTLLTFAVWYQALGAFMYNSGIGQSYTEAGAYSLFQIHVHNFASYLFRKGRRAKPSLLRYLPSIPESQRSVGHVRLGGEGPAHVLRTDRGCWVQGERLLVPERRFYRVERSFV